MKALTAIGSLVAIVAGVLGILAYFQDPGTPDENQAQLFLEAYYATAPENPTASWGMTSESYRDQELVGGLGSYSDYWRTMRTVTIDDFGLSEDPQRPGWWVARVNFVEVSGRKSRPYFQYQLVCTWQANLPWNSCDSSHVHLNKVRQYRPAEYDRR